MSRKKFPSAITIFGAKGDLTKRKLIPALFNLYADNHLPPVFSIFCVDFVAVDETDYRNDLLAGVNEFSRNGKADPEKWAAFAARINYVQGDFVKKETYESLKGKIKEFEEREQQRGVDRRAHV